MAADTLGGVVAELESVPFSTISDHGRRCCRVARHWYAATDRARRTPMTPPSWLPAEKHWGPSPWPIHWCELWGYEAWDCGVLAGVSLAILARRGERALPVQLVQTASETEVQHWRARWQSDGIDSRWIRGRFVYHEAVALEHAGAIRVWDSTRDVFVRADDVLAQSPNVAMRIRSEGSARHLDWHGTDIITGLWHQKVGRAWRVAPAAIEGSP